MCIRDRDGAVGAYRHAGRAFGNLDIRLQRLAVGRDDRAVGRHGEIAGAGISGAAVGQQHLKEAGAFDRHVERIARGVERTLRIDARGATQFDAGAEVEACLLYTSRCV